MAKNKKVGFYGGKFNIIHNGHISAALQAYSQVDKLYIIVMYDEDNEYIRGRDIDPFIRVRWWKTILKDFPNCEVISLYSKNTMDFDEWKRNSLEILEIIPDLTHVFYAEEEYTQIFKELYTDKTLCLLDKKTYGGETISASRIFKQGVYNSYEMLPQPVKKHFNKRVVVLGAESSGKSTLVKKLAAYYNTNYVEEYGRTLWESYGVGEGKAFIPPDYVELTIMQKAEEYKAISHSNRVLFIDTETIVTNVWLEMYEGLEFPLLKQMAEYEDYDLFILIPPVREFFQDGTRNFESEREIVYNKMKKQVEYLGKNYIELSDNFENHLQESITYVEELFKESV